MSAQISRRSFILSGLAASGSLALVACGGSQSASSSAGSTGGSSSAKTLTVAASPQPHAKILSEFVAPELSKLGIELVVKEFTDYVQPNEVVFNGEMDANYFQHINYLDNYNKENNENLISVGKIHYEPFGIYAGKSSDLSAIADGAEVAVPNDPTNEARALLLLQQAGLIKLKDPDNLSATPNDISENPHNIKFREIEAAATPRALQDVDFAAINGNYALEAGLHAADALKLEEASGVAFEQYANVIATRPELEKDERIVALVEVLSSDGFATYLKDNFGQDVLPA